MTSDPEPNAVLRALLADPAASFAIGVPAAVAEFMRAPGEAADVSEVGEGGLAVATPRGAIRVSLSDHVRPLAYETPSRRPERWLQGLVFCLPAAQAGLAGRRVLSALGPDAEALAARDREAALFDLGVGARHIEFCVRTAEAELCALLRDHCGLTLTDWPADLAAAVFAANPQRVVRSRLGRIEVTGPIPSERTPLGPHTHLFPDKLPAGPDPAIPLPAGWLPALQIYPPHPQFDLAGEPIPFDRTRHAAFQALLEAWGEPGFLAAKARALAALRAGRDAADEGPAWEVARRQWQAELSAA